MKKIIVLLLLLTTFVVAQEEDKEEPLEDTEAGRIPLVMVVDRPSFGFPSFVVGDGVVSLESGVLVTVQKGSSEALTTTPQILRVGTADNFELRMTTSGLNFQSGSAGWADLTPGFKWRVLDEENASVSLLTALNVPVGSSKFRSDAVSGSLTVCADFPVTDANNVLINVGANTNGNSGRDDVLTAFFTAGISQSVTDKFSLYFEVAGFSPQEVGGPSTMAGDIVAAYLVNPDLQLDLAGFKGFSSTGLDWGVTLGISNRF